MFIHPRKAESFVATHFRLGYGRLRPLAAMAQLSRRFCVRVQAFEMLCSSMVTLRALPSISTLLSQTQKFSSREANSERRKLSLGRLSPHVKQPSRPRRLAVVMQGLRAEGVSSEIGGRHGDEDSREVAAVESVSTGGFAGFVQENARELAIASAVFTLVSLSDEHALALGPGGPLMEEFWDNVRRYGFYFFTVVSGGLYSLAKPLLDLLKDPSTQILVLIAVTGTFYLMYLTVSTMLGLNDFVYQYAQ